ncbi:LLM class flavin-dependent oxidoreductase [Galbibacter pacificus]|uniref:LLM class flavin-dependent oxidoreductase n=1 Tax=Galbibacter pacificus TaxID=2996052 RepID=A0ABT6FS80_9FLAO|nr:LLM class flavin-dependent oxidoreductase [Galbibacter pacificus]MDG3582754.1 LLM class flavin-dependent oxidoreductase [Galbibacter pacificus]MDG3586127.1 LLM class flavin-dependent oxidoreductase [Galbibacter pacificus]
MSHQNTLSNTKFSVLDLVPVPQGSHHKTAMNNSLDLARHAEKYGYERFWVSEHHNMESLVSSATVVLLGYIAQGTTKIRVGSGGVMLPNHAPLIVAEQFGTLAILYPNRIDLGLGRAPGTDQLTAQALRRGKQESVQDFPNDINELQQYFLEENENERVRAIPGEGLEVPIYLLGSSTFSAQLAAQKGLPYAFASHFAPGQLFSALDIYTEGFKPSKQLESPYPMACVNVIAADTDEEAQRLATSLYQFAMGIVTNLRRPLPPPIDSMEGIWTPEQEAMIKNMMYFTFIGSKATIEKELSKFIKTTQVKEIITVSHIFDHRERIKSYKILSEVFNS